MVEQHDECLECLAKIKNRTDIYRTLADNNKPSNNVIKSLQRLSSSASNNRLKTCLQFLIIKVNEKSIQPPQKSSNNCNGGNSNNLTLAPNSNGCRISPRSLEAKEIVNRQTTAPTTIEIEVESNGKSLNKRQKLQHIKLQEHLKQQQQQENIDKQHRHNHKTSNHHHHRHHLASPPQDQVSSTQNQDELDDSECQTSPVTMVSNDMNDELKSNVSNQDSQQESPSNGHINDQEDHDYEGGYEHDNDGQASCSSLKARSSPSENSINIHRVDSSACISVTATATTTTITTSTSTSTSPCQLIEKSIECNNVNAMSTASTNTEDIAKMTNSTCSQDDSKHLLAKGERFTSTNNSSAIIKHNGNLAQLENDNSSTISWPSSYPSPPSPLSTSSTSSISSQDSSSCSPASSHLSPSPSPSPEFVNELKGPRLKLSEEKIRKIKKRPITYEDFYIESSFASSSTPTTSSGCSPGPSSITTTPNSDQGYCRFPPAPVHLFQAPPRLYIHLKPYVAPPSNLDEQHLPEASPPVKKPKIETVNCAICGVKEDILEVEKLYGQYGCKICASFFKKFLDNPVELYCCQDGDCIMAFDSRCRACWVKICLQKFDIGDDLREKIGVKFQPRLLSSPNVSLITIDTSLT